MRWAFPLPDEEKTVSSTCCALALGFSPCLSRKRPSQIPRWTFPRQAGRKVHRGPTQVLSWALSRGLRSTFPSPQEGKVRPHRYRPVLKHCFIRVLKGMRTRFIVKRGTFNRKKTVAGMPRTIRVHFFIEFFRATTFFSIKKYVFYALPKIQHSKYIEFFTFIARNLA